MTKLLVIDGLPVVDAKRTLALTITKRDINRATPLDPSCCAVARACAREFGGEARVYKNRIYLKTPTSKRWLRYQTPSAMRTELITYDRASQFQPGDYTLNRLSPSQRTGRAQSATRNEHRPSTKKRRAPHILIGVRGGPLQMSA